MKMNLRKVLMIPALLLIGSFAFASDTPIGSGSFKCITKPIAWDDDPSEPLAIELVNRNGRLVAIVNGELLNKNVVPKEYTIKNIPTDIESPDTGNLNIGEQRILDILLAISGPGNADILHISIDVTKIAKVKFFKITRASEKKAGAILETYDTQGNLMGHLVSAWFPTQCY